MNTDEPGWTPVASPSGVYPPPAWRADARPSDRPDDRSDRIGLTERCRVRRLARFRRRPVPSARFRGAKGSTPAQFREIHDAVWPRARLRDPAPGCRVATLFGLR